MSIIMKTWSSSLLLAHITTRVATSKVVAVLLVITIIWLPTTPCQARTRPLEIQNYKFFDSVTGESVNIKAAAYYPRPNAGLLNTNNFDFFHDEFRHVWEPDIDRFVELGLNAIRIYAVDPVKDHDGFMCALQEAGIYVIVGLAANCANCSITNDAAPNCYPPELKTRGHMIIGAFAKYDNVLGFSAGNEVGLVSRPEALSNAPCQKKFLRDMREYLANCPNTRNIPIGIVIADVVRDDKLAYYNCGGVAGNADLYETAEWIGLNTYVSCDGNVMELDNAIGYQNLIRDLQHYSIPVLLTEYGCLNPSFPTIDGFQAQRNFLPAAWVHQEGMRDTVAGTFVFEYSTELVHVPVPYPFNLYSPGNFGIGYYTPEHCNHVDTKCTYVPKPEFYNLQIAHSLTPTRGALDRTTFVADSSRLNRSPCPVDIPGIGDLTWEADGNPGLFCPGMNSMTCPTGPTPAPSMEPTNIPELRSKLTSSQLESHWFSNLSLHLVVVLLVVSTALLL